ncbi:biotin--[acetyl-CoA-carboxylase] ligase [Paenibacillus thermoaerophilus]|uniref:Bifunctional ligase/repressor BirA n=1 Tax=Paenibacillus thermoaerophilus TaxID=1215385 RepID=A0ABW2V5B5_9BACL|nr:biotin--[acetyl-CoA-carboxylase] ligase [Paenibacillus thermoaerophilus]TMV18676.1 biotin--[acetyl-CoA-carboxylase] ligase [Paenibacillus thermoaerophilus]
MKLVQTDELEAWFRARPGQWLSGAELSRQWGVSRSAVWKHIRALELRGYRFESAPRRGYRLVQLPDRIRLDEVLPRLATHTIGRSWKLLETVESTQTVAQQWVQDGAKEGSIVLAEQQTSGRGRMGRQWHSPIGKGIYMSMILTPRVPMTLLPQITLLTAVALCRTMRKQTGVDAGIKWPNDILAGGRKVSGILLESSAEDERIRHVIAGVGISVNLEASDYPEELRAIATSLRIESGKTVDRAEFLAAFLNEFETLYDAYHRDGFGPIRSLWEALSVTLNRPVAVNGPQGTIEGVAEGLDDLGALLVRKPDGTLERVMSGEIPIVPGPRPGRVSDDA